MFTIGISFLGQYRPAYFQSENLNGALIAAGRAIKGMPEAELDWFLERLRDGRSAMKPNCSAWSAEHGCRAVFFRRGAHDPFLDSVTRDMTPAPGLDYSEAANR
jgi:hypothetical protein